ncbi:MAG: dienelactone hydrolase family protein [Pseudomonadota bacterium]
MKIHLLAAVLALFTTSSFASGGAINYTVNGQDYEGYYVSPSADAPLVLLVHDWDGLTDYEIKRAHMLADMGYAVFAADLFGAGVRPTEVKDKRQHTGELYKDRNKMRALLDGALATAGKQGGNVNNAVAMGYCFGGAAVLEMARSGADLKGFATFHGGLKTPQGQDYTNAKGKVLVMHGTADTAITMDQFAGLASELEAQGVKHEMVTYSGAPHAFTVFGSNRYREDADKKSWALFSSFLDEVSE